ncbi:hypothetical protein [Stenotrophomonas sp.]|uniref:hypothetical protein n=1 Tax=Stenotrophomonas sp. TaxID=69392 RepID=UPI00289BB469|nr:hypothetical protein [Stenotrophomonas sp.]
MDWSAVHLDETELRLMRTFVDLAPQAGVGTRALAQASRVALGDSDGWQRCVPGGPTGILWRISEVSDASMLAPFQTNPARDMAEVITTRFAQNQHLKPFVRRVMHYDMLHPVQALARMQRTAKVMFACCARQPAPGVVAHMALNLVYTALVFLWLFDRSAGDATTRAATVTTGRWFRW